MASSKRWHLPVLVMGTFVEGLLDIQALCGVRGATRFVEAGGQADATATCRSCRRIAKLPE